mmetsp:Transcript_13739/g.30812  ORF Transcript_13739/g.30812 Transcript_13739/m.30812 type:complete len:331 (+) Transcript_13739:75-1067(+)
MPFLEIDDLTVHPAPPPKHQIYYRLFPEHLSQDDVGDRPRVLLLMGMGGIHQVWNLQVQHLEQFCNVCAMDNRGTGYSSCPESEWRWTTNRMALDAICVLNTLRWNERVHVVGISLGGMIAQELALDVPERIASLTLIGTYPSALRSMPTPRALLEFGRSLGLLARDPKERGKAALRLNFPEAWLQQFSPSDLHGGKVVSHQRWVSKLTVQLFMDIPSELRSSGKKAALTAPVAVLLRQLSAVMTHRVTHQRCERLRRRGVPISIITGSDDVLVRPMNSHILGKLFEAPVTTLAGCGHGLIHQSPGELNALIEATVRAGERGVRPSASKL